jgi:dimethylhistidine N-methyltransferase
MALPQQCSAQGVVRFYDFLPEHGSFMDQVLQGLSQPQKSLPARYLHDARGRELYERVCELPDYHIARAELALMHAHADSMAKFLGADCQLIEFGAGSSKRTRILIEALQPPLYVLIDVDCEAMKATADGLVQQFPWLNIIGVCADYASLPTLPAFVGVPIRRKAVYFPGSNLGHFDAEEALALLKLARRMVGTGGALLLGIDPMTDKAALDASCKDPSGLAAAFNLNLLARINRELDADFQLRRFDHKRFYDAKRGRIETHIQSLAAQLAHVGGVRLRFEQGETIRTEISCKPGMDEFSALAQRAGFGPGQAWGEAADLFCVQGMIAV